MTMATPEPELRGKIRTLALSLANHEEPHGRIDDPHHVYEQGYHDASTSIGIALLNLIGETL